MQIGRKYLTWLCYKRKGQNLCFALSHCQNIKTTTAYEKNLFEMLMNQRYTDFQYKRNKIMMVSYAFKSHIFQKFSRLLVILTQIIALGLYKKITF
jgi:hypothetical protein